ncbi:hypothetical protein [Tsukamurella sp. 1534]|uniref:hypothetical protein n=1 Tax=Tsukamurella sp. 1534 TaxID=1151061 RepID=UPI0002E19EB5|nr:hypothetical protein [Tsukamurella sp. 1534]
MNRRCALSWFAALLFLVAAAVTHYRGGMGGVDGLCFVLALAWMLVGIQTHQPAGWRG